MKRYLCIFFLIFLLIFLLSGCSDGQENASEPDAAETVSPQTEEISDYIEIPFQIWESEDGSGLEYAVLMRSWNGESGGFPGYVDYFASIYENYEKYPQTIFDGAVLCFSFGDYDLPEVTVTRDADTYHRDDDSQEADAASGVTVSYIDGVYSFTVEYGDDAYLYYSILCTWENLGSLEYVIYIGTPAAGGRDGYISVCMDYLLETEPLLYESIDYSAATFRTIEESEILTAAYLVEDPQILDETDILITLTTGSGDYVFRGIVDSQTSVLIGYIPEV